MLLANVKKIARCDSEGEKYLEVAHKIKCGNEIWLDADKENVFSTL